MAIRFHDENETGRVLYAERLGQRVRVVMETRYDLLTVTLTAEEVEMFAAQLRLRSQEVRDGAGGVSQQ